MRTSCPQGFIYSMQWESVCHHYWIQFTLANTQIFPDFFLYSHLWCVRTLWRFYNASQGQVSRHWCTSPCSCGAMVWYARYQSQCACINGGSMPIYLPYEIIGINYMARTAVHRWYQMITKKMQSGCMNWVAHWAKPAKNTKGNTETSLLIGLWWIPV